MRIFFRLRRSALVLSCILFFCATSFAGIWLATVTGTCLDEHGKPVPGATLRFTDQANGRQFETRTDPAGTFSYIAAPSAIYTLRVAREGKPPVTFENIVIEWSSRPLTLDINLEHGTAKITRSTMQPEFFRSDETPAALVAQDNADQSAVAAINQQLAAAKQLSDQGDWQGAIHALWSAIEIDPKRDLPWALLGAAYYNTATHSADGKALLNDSVRSYQKAIAIAPAAAYHNNLGNTYVKLKQYDEAVQQYRQADLLNPGQSGLYQQNIGLALVEEAQSAPDDSALELLQRALEAFNRVLSAAPPNNAEVLYWKGLSQLRLAANGQGSYDGVASSFREYLKLAPHGRFAAEVQSMLQALPGVDKRQ